MSYRTFITSVALCCSLFLSAQGPVYQKLYGLTNYYCFAPGIIATSDGFFLVVGAMSNGSIYHQDIVASKINIFGDTLWTRRYCGLGSEMAYNALEDSTGYMIFGITNSFGDESNNFTWIKTDFNGDTISTGVYGGSASENYATGVKSGNNFYVYGTTLSFDSTQSQQYLLKLNQNGQVIWNKTYGGIQVIASSGIVTCHDGGIVLAGITNYSGSSNLFINKIDTSGTILWTKYYAGNFYQSPYAIIETEDYGFLIVGNQYDTIGAPSPMFAMKLDSLGNVEWAKTYGGTNSDYARSIARCASGGYVITGCSYSFGAGLCDAVLLRIDNAGDTLWSRVYGNTMDDAGESVIEAPDSYFMISGEATNMTNGRMNYMILRTDSLGHAGCDEHMAPYHVGNFTVVPTSLNMQTGSVGTSYSRDPITRKGLELTTVCVGVGVSENQEEAPAHCSIILRNENILDIQLSGTRNARYVIYDFLGREIMTGQLSENYNSVILPALAPGMYVCAVFDKDNVVGTNKFVVVN